MKKIDRQAMSGHFTGRVAQIALTATMVAVLVACGGGGGDAGTPITGGGGSSGGGTGTGGGATTAPTIGLSLSSATVTAAAPATVKATVKDSNGVGVAGVVVTFGVTGGLGTLSPTTALTDVNGVATTTLTPTAATSSGADSVTATASVGSSTLTASGGFQLTATDVAISSFSADVTSLAAYGQTGLTVKLSGTSPSAPVTVALSSACVTANHASVTPATVTTSTGTATFTFRDNGCGSYQSSDTLQATVTGSAATRSLTVPIVSPTVASISFATATPSTIYLKGSGAVESSLVSFRILDANGNGVPNQSVDLTATSWAGGLKLDDVTNTTVTRTSDSTGTVIVRVNSGTVPTPVRVKAALSASPDVQAVSSLLAVAVGLPSQLNFSLAQATANIEGFDYDGTVNSYTVTVSDRMSNPVPDGTAISFVAEGGQINASGVTARNAQGIATATANFVSASPKPADGRVTVTAYALGEESFVDQNGNNVYDAGEPFQDLGDIYVDRLLNNFYNADVDQLISASLGASQACNAWATEPGKSLLSLNASIPSKPGSCDQAWGRAYVRRSTETVFSRSGASPLFAPINISNVSGCARRTATDFGYNFGTDGAGNVSTWYGYSAEATPRPNKVSYGVFGTGLMYAGGDSGTMRLYVADSNTEAFNPMPAGTTITAAGSTGIATQVLGGSPVPATTLPSLATIGYTFSTGVSSGTVTVSFTTPKGVTTSITQSVTSGAGGGGCP